jgi:hypothetical protein
MTDSVQDLKNRSALFLGAGGDRIPPHGTTHGAAGSDPIPQEIGGLPVDLTGITTGDGIVLGPGGVFVPGTVGDTATRQTTYDAGASVLVDVDDHSTRTTGAGGVVAMGSNKRAQVVAVGDSGATDYAVIAADVVTLADSNLLAPVSISSPGNPILSTVDQSLVGAINETALLAVGGYRIFSYIPTTDPATNWTRLKAAVAAAKAATPAPSATDPVVVLVHAVEHEGSAPDYINIDFSYVTLYCSKGARYMDNSLDAPSWALVERAGGRLYAPYTGFGALLISAPYVTLDGIDTDASSGSSIVIQYTAGAIVGNTFTARNSSFGESVEMRTATSMTMENCFVEKEFLSGQVFSGIARDCAFCGVIALNKMSGAIVERCRIGYTYTGLQAAQIENARLTDCRIVGDNVFFPSTTGSIGAGVVFERCRITCDTLGHADSAVGYNRFSLLNCDVTFTATTEQLPLGDGGTIQGGRYLIRKGSGASILVNEDTGPIVKAIIHNTAGYAQCIAAGSGADFSTLVPEGGKLTITGNEFLSTDTASAIDAGVPYEGGNVHTTDASSPVDRTRLYIDTMPAPDPEWTEFVFETNSTGPGLAADIEVPESSFGTCVVHYSYCLEGLSTYSGTLIANFQTADIATETIAMSYSTVRTAQADGGESMVDEAVIIGAEFSGGAYRIGVVAGFAAAPGALIGIYKLTTAVLPVSV